MTIYRFNDNKLMNKGSFQKDENLETWVRNKWWPSVSITSSDEKIVGLYALFPNSRNPLALLCSGSSYSVDYGAGPTTYSSGVKMEAFLDYNSSIFDNTNIPVTFTTGTNIVTKTSHGYVDGDTIQFYDISSVTTINDGVLYYVINSTANTFQISTTFGGSPITFNANGTGALLPYKIAIVTIEPVSGDITTANFKQIATGEFANSSNSNWIEIQVSLANLTSISLGGIWPYCTLLENFRFLKCGSLITFANLFGNCYNLRNFEMLSESTTVTSLDTMFSGCSNLITAPYFDTSGATSSSNMFSYCNSLRRIPKYDLSSVTNATTMFFQCYSLEEVPSLNFSSSLTIATSLFHQCRKLKKISNLGDTSAVTNMVNMFNGCQSLEYLPELDCSSATSLDGTFATCQSLTELRFKNTENITSLSGTFNGCTNLREVYGLNTLNVKNFTSTFNNCTSLVNVQTLNMSNANTINSIFNNCGNLKYINLSNTTNQISIFNNAFNSTALVTIIGIDMSNTSGNFTNSFNNMRNLQRVVATGISNNVFFQNTMLSNTALDEIFTNLATVSGKTINITGSIGAATCTRSIATSKGWSVTG